MPAGTEAEAVAAARALQARHGGLAVLIKRGAAGCTLVEAGGGREPLRQAAFAVDKVAPWSGSPPCARQG